MSLPWSITTTVRNPIRNRDFLKTISEFEGLEFNEEIQLTEIFAVGVANGITPGNVILVSESIEFQKYFPASALRQGQLITYQDVNSLVIGLLMHLTTKGSLSVKISIP